MEERTVPRAQNKLIELNLQYIDRIRKTNSSDPSFKKLLRIQNNLTFIDLTLSECDHERSVLFVENEELKGTKRKLELLVRSLEMELTKLKEEFSQKI